VIATVPNRTIVQDDWERHTGGHWAALRLFRHCLDDLEGWACLLQSKMSTGLYTTPSKTKEEQTHNRFLEQDRAVRPHTKGTVHP
jgi:hypothetical protein